MKTIRYFSIPLLAILLSHNSMAGYTVIMDKDNDKVPDHIDKCPDTPQLRKVDLASKYSVLFSKDERSVEPRSIAVDQKGCALDSDRDGVPDYKDYCPDNSAIELSAGIHSNGCPLHSDGDGTPDYRDKCPDTPRGIKTDNKGCPVSLTETDAIRTNTSLSPVQYRLQ